MAGGGSGGRGRGGGRRGGAGLGVAESEGEVTAGPGGIGGNIDAMSVEAGVGEGG